MKNYNDNNHGVTAYAATDPAVIGYGGVENAHHAARPDMTAFDEGAFATEGQPAYGNVPHGQPTFDAYGYGAEHYAVPNSAPAYNASQPHFGAPPSALQDQLAQLSNLIYYDSGSINANTNFSLFYHNAFTQKLRFEMANMMIVADHYASVFDTLQSVSQLFAENGFAGLSAAKNMTNSQFMKNLLTIMSDDWPENAEHTPFARAMYWVLPTLLSGASRDRNFIENTLYYEGLLMIACGNYPYNMVQFRLLGLLGIQLSLEECLVRE